jgi:hypothetical protein
MTNFIEIFPFHDNEEKFLCKGVCIIHPTYFDNDLALNMERGEILFNYETEFRIPCSILHYVPSNALLFIIDLTEVFAWGDHPDFTGELLFVSGKSYSRFYGFLPDENFKIQVEEAYSINDRIIFTGEINRIGIINDYTEIFRFCMKFDKNDDLYGILKNYFIISGQNCHHDAPNKLFFPKLTDKEDGSILQWSGVSAIKYLSTTFYSLDLDNARGDEIPLNTIAENIAIDKNTTELIYSLLSVEYRGGIESAFLILYLDQPVSFIKSGHDKIIISFDGQINFLEICSHENNTSFIAESFNVISDQNIIYLMGKFSVSKGSENIYRSDTYNIIVAFEKNYEITEFILDFVRGYQLWELSDIN